MTGVFCVLFTAIGYGINGAIVRKIKDVHFTVIEAYNAAFTFLGVSGYILIEHYITNKNKTMRIFTYHKELYYFVLVGTIFAILAGNSMTLARTSYKLAFTMLFSFETLVFALIADNSIFQLGINF